jgi:DNA-binding protein H-NS
VSQYRELLKQRQALEEQIQQALASEKAQVIEEIRQKLVDYRIDLAELDPARGKRGAKGQDGRKTGHAAVPAKYRDPASDKTWSGRGKPPAWIAGQDREKFLIK